jgi:site-specific recombinase XerD
VSEVRAFVDWMRDKRSATRQTLDKYQRVCEAWAGFSETPLAERTPEQVEAFTGRARRGGRKAADATVAVEIAVLGSFYRWGQARLDWPSNPATLAGRPKVHNRNPRPVSDGLWRALWSCESLPDDARVALGLGYFAGLRRSEIVALRGSQVSWGRQLVNFTRKGGGEDTFDYGDVLDHFTWSLPELVIDPALLEAPLRRLTLNRAERRVMPWGDYIAPVAVNKRLPAWLRLAGLASDAITPHMLRHSFATNLLRTGVPLALASDLCNHSSPTITMRYVKTGGGQLAGLRNGSLVRVDTHA